jgi:RNA polymerase sigma factor (TIGR02999 family)
MADGEVTELLAQLAGGDSTAYDQLFERVYEPMRRRAAAKLAGERPGHTISPTVLVHETYLKLVGQDRASFDSRAHFLSVAAMAMRRILIHHDRARAADKRGGGARLFTLEEESAGQVAASAAELLALDRVITRLSGSHPRPARVVVFKLFGGLTDPEIAEALGVSAPTVRRDWRFARAWLQREIGGPQ